MGPSEIVVTLGGIVLSGVIAWFFWFAPKVVTRAVIAGGVQEVTIVVKGGYTPDVIVVQHGRPVRLNFLRQETSACSETVILGDFGKSAFLPPGKLCPSRSLPTNPASMTSTVK